MVQKDEEISEILKKKENSERNLQMKKNILERLEVIEKINEEKYVRIKYLADKVEKLENSLSQDKYNQNLESDEPSELNPCEYCDFQAKNQRGLQLHIKAKHEVTKVEISVFCKATEKYLSSGKDS